MAKKKNTVFDANAKGVLKATPGERQEEVDRTLLPGFYTMYLGKKIEKKRII